MNILIAIVLSWFYTWFYILCKVIEIYSKIKKLFSLVCFKFNTNYFICAENKNCMYQILLNL